MAEWKQRATINGEVVSFRYSGISQAPAARDVFVWDLDKTYLDTKFESINGLIKTVLEKAFQKKNVPGTGTLVRALRNSWQIQHGEVSDFPIFFITASPPLMERRVIEKLHLDGIYPFGLYCKDNLKNLKPGRLFRLTLQLGFKVQALLQLRKELHPEVKQVLWGDDSESDAIIYSLYSDICARRLQESDLVRVLKGFKVPGAQIDTILALQADVPKQDPVDRIYINLAIDTDADYYSKFGRRIIATYDSLQAALDLYQCDRLSQDQVLRVAQDLFINYNFNREELEISLKDLLNRSVLKKATFEKIFPFLVANHVVGANMELPAFFGTTVDKDDSALEPWVPEQIDYLHDYR